MAKKFFYAAAAEREDASPASGLVLWPELDLPCVHGFGGMPMIQEVQHEYTRLGTRLPRGLWLIGTLLSLCGCGGDDVAGPTEVKWSNGTSSRSSSPIAITSKRRRPSTSWLPRRVR